MCRVPARGGLRPLDHLRHLRVARRPRPTRSLERYMQVFDLPVAAMIARVFRS